MTRYFTDEHEWIEVDGTSATVGITDYAQGQLGDIVFVETPDAGKKLSKGGDAAVVESVKAASDVYAPVSGTVTEGNPALADDPALVNSDPEGEGWFFKLTLDDPSQLDWTVLGTPLKTFLTNLLTALNALNLPVSGATAGPPAPGTFPVLPTILSSSVEVKK